MLREQSAELIHKEWEMWAKTIVRSEPNISEERKQRWISECFKPYNELSEEMKDLDRIFADKFISLANAIVKDRFLDQAECIKRLCNDYRVHSNLFVAFDFDNTVFDYHKIGDTFPKLEALLIRCKSIGLKLILFTGNEGVKLNSIVDYCRLHGYEPDFINENPIMKTRKPYYNILLDDRAGLNDAYQTLVITLNLIQNA